MRLLSKPIVFSVLLASCQPMSIIYHNPESLLKTDAFTQVVEVKAEKLLFISGQVALDKNGSLLGDDLASQFQKSLQNVGKALKAAGSDWQSLAQLKIYVVDLKPEHRFLIMMEMDKVFADGARPANTLLGVQGLARKDLRVEIEAIAIVN